MTRMTAEQFEEALRLLDMSQADAGRFLDVDTRNIRRWADANDPMKPPIGVAMLFAVMLANGLKPADVLHLADAWFPMQEGAQ